MFLLGACDKIHYIQFHHWKGWSERLFRTSVKISTKCLPASLGVIRSLASSWWSGAVRAFKSTSNCFHSSEVRFGRLNRERQWTNLAHTVRTAIISQKLEPHAFRFGELCDREKLWDTTNHPHHSSIPFIIILTNCWYMYHSSSSSSPIVMTPFIIILTNCHHNQFELYMEQSTCVNSLINML